MRKYLLAILVIILLSAGVVVGLLLVQQRQIFNQKASSPTGTATVSITPAIASFERNVAHPISVYFNTKGLLVSGVKIQLTFSNLGVTASGIQISSGLISSGDWNCPVKSVTSLGSTGQIDISCVNTSPIGYSNNVDTLLATFNLLATEVPVVNPLIVSFDPVQTTLTQKSDSADIALTPASTGSYTITDTIAGSPTPTSIVFVTSPTSTPNSTLLAQATSTPTAIATATATVAAIPTKPPIPVTGFDTPTIIGAVGGGLLLLVGALVLIF